MARIKRIYGKVTGVTSIGTINKKIRKQIERARSRPKITELVRRSQYLVTLTFGSPWKKAFRGKIMKMRQRAKKEFAKTAREANRTLKRKRISGRPYDEKYGRGRRVTVK